jgi:hypothetical protein
LIDNSFFPSGWDFVIVKIPLSDRMEVIETFHFNKEEWNLMTEKHIAQEYLDRISQLNDPVAKIVTTHLFTEYWLDRLLSGKTMNPESLQNINTNYYTKLHFAHSLVTLPKGLYDNLIKLNKLRNKCAHNLNFDFVNIDYNYDLSNLHPHYGLSKNNSVKDNLNIIGIITFGWLNNYAQQVLGIIK